MPQVLNVIVLLHDPFWHTGIEGRFVGIRTIPHLIRMLRGTVKRPSLEDQSNVLFEVA